MQNNTKQKILGFQNTRLILNQISVNAKFAKTQILRLKSGLKVKMKVTGGPPAIFRGGRDLLE